MRLFNQELKKSKSCEQKEQKEQNLGRGRARAADVSCHPFLAMSVGDDAFLLALAGLVAADDVDMVRCLHSPMLEHGV